MAIYPDTLDPARLSDSHGLEVWRRTIKVGQGSIIVLGACHTVEEPGGGRKLEASVTVTSLCCPRSLPVSSVVIWNEYGDEALGELKELENTVEFNA